MAVRHALWGPPMGPALSLEWEVMAGVTGLENVIKRMAAYRLTWKVPLTVAECMCWRFALAVKSAFMWIGL